MTVPPHSSKWWTQKTHKLYLSNILLKIIYFIIAYFIYVLLLVNLYHSGTQTTSEHNLQSGIWKNCCCDPTLLIVFYECSNSIVSMMPLINFCWWCLFLSVSCDRCWAACVFCLLQGAGRPSVAPSYQQGEPYISMCNIYSVVVVLVGFMCGRAFVQGLGVFPVHLLCGFCVVWVVFCFSMAGCFVL